MGELWRYVYASTAGTAHLESGLPCQDASAVRRIPGRHGEALLLVCADGAGSARLAQEGALLACTAMVGEVRHHLDVHPLATTRGKDVEAWVTRVQAALWESAEAQGVQPSDLACTLLFAVLDEGRAIFGQIGDGAMVVEDGGVLDYLFWPQNGEYANVTRFLTEPDAPTCMDMRIRDTSCLRAVALFTDGLQSLALQADNRSVHAPFFRPMLNRLAEESPGLAEGLLDPLRNFLEGPAVNERTSDDKTLILATLGPG